MMGQLTGRAQEIAQSSGTSVLSDEPSPWTAGLQALTGWFTSFTAETWVAFAAAGIALVALYFTGIAAKAAKDQTAIQRQLRIDAAQPYICGHSREP